MLRLPHRIAGGTAQPGSLPSDQRLRDGFDAHHHTGEVPGAVPVRQHSLPQHIRHAMEEAAKEEEDHLAWCEERIREPGGAPSKLNLLFYAMSYAMGATAGLIGDRWSLGFVSETETRW